MDFYDEQTVDLFYRTLSIHAIGYETQLVKAGAEDLHEHELHAERLAKLLAARSYFLSRGWRIHVIEYAYLARHAEWVFFASKEPINEAIQESLDRWFQYRIKAFQILQISIGV